MRGLIIGKFYPLHKGHCFLIDVALGVCDEVCVFLCSRADEHIRGEQRLEWIKEEYPQLTLYHVTKEISEAHASNPQAPHIWSNEIQRLLGEKKIDYVFASEEYGRLFAQNLHAEFLMVDIQRAIVPISASEIRQHIYEYWDFLADSVKPNFVKIITVDGKEVLVQVLAENLGAMYIQPNDMLSAMSPDTAKIWEARINALKRQNYPLIMCNLNSEVTTNAQEILKRARTRHITINSETDVQHAIDWWLDMLKTPCEEQ